MLWVKVSLLFIAALLCVIVASLVLLRGARRINNISFFGLSTAMAGWTVGVGIFLLTQDPNVAMFWAKFYYFWPLAIALWLYLFVASFPDSTRVPLLKMLPIILGFASLAGPLILVQDFLTEQLVYHAWGKEIILNKPQYLVYSAYLLIVYPLCLYSMYRMSKARQGVYAAQAEVFSIGFFIALVFGVTFNLFLPWFGNYKLIWIGPIFTSAFIIAIAYSIIKHRMFDVRLVIARSIAYLLSLTAVASVYGFLVFGLSEYVFNIGLSVKAQVFLALATGIASLAFAPLKKRFDRFTNRLFYRDAYDSQEFFDTFNKALVTTVDLDVLLRNTTQTIVTYLKADYCVVGVKDGSSLGYRVVGTASRAYSGEDVSAARSMTPHIHRSIIVTDDLGSENGGLKSLLIKNNIAVLVRLTQDVSNNKEGLGYIALGAKKSGKPYGSQDIRVLEAAANELIIAIQNAMRFEEIERFSKTLQEKVEDATRQLRQKNARLHKLDQTKDDFISMASHQLRTPLTSIKGYVSMTLDGDAGKLNDGQTKMLTQAFLSAQRMVYLISDLLNVSRLKTGKFVIEPVESNLAKVIEEELEQLTETVKSRNLELVYHKPEHFPTLMMDETKIRQVIMNFVDNAIYYTPNGGRIEVHLADKSGSIEFTVVDNGIGVPKHEQHHLFSKFYRAKNAQSARPDGTGLGLFMAKKVVIAQGGAIIFKSAEGKGSTFGFTFPKSALTPKAEPPKPESTPKES